MQHFITKLFKVDKAFFHHILRFTYIFLWREKLCFTKLIGNFGVEYIYGGSILFLLHFSECVFRNFSKFRSNFCRFLYFFPRFFFLLLPFVVKPSSYPTNSIAICNYLLVYEKGSEVREKVYSKNVSNVNMGYGEKDVLECV